jgi:DNA repair protein SbcC/Rad50
LFPIADQLSQIETLLGRYANQKAEAEKFQQLKTEAEEAAAGLKDSLAVLETQIDTEANSQRQATEKAQVLELQLQGSEESRWQTDEEQITTLHRQAREQRDQASRYQTATKKFENATTEFQDATSAQSDAETRATAAECAIREHTKRRSDIHHNTELAEQSLEKRSAHLRSLLIVGQHCPVCGATEHELTCFSQLLPRM